MTTVEIALPDRLAEQAREAGLLSPLMIANLLSERLRIYKVDELFAAMDRVEAADDSAYMSPEEVAEEMSIMRAERRREEGL